MGVGRSNPALPHTLQGTHSRLKDSTLDHILADQNRISHECFPITKTNVVHPSDKRFRKDMRGMF